MAGRREGGEVRAFIVSFAVGFVVGMGYGLIRVKSPAPPFVALLGLLGMVIGEQLVPVVREQVWPWIAALLRP